MVSSLQNPHALEGSSVVYFYCLVYIQHIFSSYENKETLLHSPVFFPNVRMDMGNIKLKIVMEPGQLV